MRSNRKGKRVPTQMIIPAYMTKVISFGFKMLRELKYLKIMAHVGGWW
jgi:hypothetical protein